MDFLLGPVADRAVTNHDRFFTVVLLFFKVVLELLRRRRARYNRHRSFLFLSAVQKQNCSFRVLFLVVDDVQNLSNSHRGNRIVGEFRHRGFERCAASRVFFYEFFFFFFFFFSVVFLFVRPVAVFGGIDPCANIRLHSSCIGFTRGPASPTTKRRRIATPVLDVAACSYRNVDLPYRYNVAPRKVQKSL